MGQFALGLRSLLVRSTIFVVMAALLAWALGGTLFPKPQTADFADQAVQFAGHKWYWRVLVGGKNTGEIRWHLLRDDDNAKPMPFMLTTYVEVAGPVLGADGVYYAGRQKDSPTAWQVARVDAAGNVQLWSMPDRLAAILQLSRIEGGKPLQDSQTILRQRAQLLDLPANSADE